MTNNSSGSERRLDFGHFVDRLFWFVITAVALYSASQLKELSNSVIELKTQLAVGISQIGFHEKRLDMQRDRMDRFEVELHEILDTRKGH